MERSSFLCSLVVQLQILLYCLPDGEPAVVGSDIVFQYALGSAYLDITDAQKMGINNRDSLRAFFSSSKYMLIHHI